SAQPPGAAATPHAPTLVAGAPPGAGGYPEYLDLFEQFGGVLECPHPEVMERSVSVAQIETLNPHFHDDRGDVVRHRRGPDGIGLRRPRPRRERRPAG